MDKKLTLSLDQSVIESAKSYAKKHKVSVSKLIETYLRSLTNKQVQYEPITPLVESLSGVLDAQKLMDDRADYTSYLEDKYQ